MKIVSCFFTPDFPVPERFLSGMDIFFDIETTPTLPLVPF